MQHDANDDLLHDAFATHHLWKSSSLFDDATTYESLLFAPLQLDVPTIQLNHPYAPKAPLGQELRLPDPATFEFGPLPPLDSSDQSTTSLEIPSTEPEDVNDDPWQVALDLKPVNSHLIFHTWETFENFAHPKRQSPYFAEAGQHSFDAALAKDAETTPAGKVLQPNLLLESLWNLGIGRSSILFSFNTKTSSFEPAIIHGRASGLSLRSAQSIINQFIDIGNIFVYLRSFVERTFAAAASIPARVALATSISSVLSTFEHYLGQHSGNIKSMLQLQHLFEKPRKILAYIVRTVDAVRHVSSNDELSSILYHRALEVQEGEEGIRRLSCEILRRVAKPSLDVVGEWVGIQQEQQTVPVAERGSFVHVQDSSENDGPAEYTYLPEAMPTYISPEDGKTIFETGNSLRFLQFHHPEHPMASLNKYAIHPPSLEWRFGWKDIEEISQRANEYEEQLRIAIVKFSKGHGPQSATSMPSSGTSRSFDENQVEGDFQAYLNETIQIFDASPNQLQYQLSDELIDLTEQVLDKTTISKPDSSENFSPPLSTTSTFSFRPLLTVQAKLVNATTLRLFFRSHQLQLHFALQRQYQLLGDGVFSSRLASALFDPERESAERHKGQMRSGVHMGLQLGSRENWPPASSELRLALMGVLSESYYSSALFYSTQIQGSVSEQKRKNDELPGQLNFAVRQLTEVEMERIMDPYGLYAIDFLRLQYVPPSPLNLVISTSSLEKYDTIFKFLLRLLRLLFVVARLPRQYPDIESRYFRVEAHHFVTTLSTYIFQTGIAEHWDAFNSYLSTLERRLSDEDIASELGTYVTESLGSLRDAHEKCLDSILFSLLLRNRQRKVMALVAEIFELVLLFAKKQNPELKVKESAKDLYVNLRGKIRVFLDVCRQLTGKKGYGKGRGTAEENTLERLNVLMEMNGYFSKSTT
ncbi:hypothetical protein DM02DRAFT_621531 [Periconia macrospinosa]|uniref:Spindle pole body component n=1 Tax=Periconia macrospinosa TaxID=97972 RepID=A0A2V1EDN7_9PLEO|nr:hypothetical protein DM02DRAFT_621531 [Periconia macrospinosa]